MVNQLLTEMDGLEELNQVVVIAATNRPDLVDPALLRPGRFDRIVFAGVPDKQSRLKILQIHTKSMPLAKGVDLDQLAEMTDNFVGADMESLCREAAMIAMHRDLEAKEVSMDDFNDALKKVKPSIRPQDVQKYKEIEDNYLRTARGAQINEVNYMG